MICNSYKIFFSTLADDTKLDIINLLSKGPKTVSDICNTLNLEQSRVSHNLKAMADRHFVAVKKAGKNRVYSLDDEYIVPILELIDEHVEHFYKNYCKCRGIPWRKRG